MVLGLVALLFVVQVLQDINGTVPKSYGVSAGRSWAYGIGSHDSGATMHGWELPRFCGKGTYDAKVLY